jgi:hypothetical protein
VLDFSRIERINAEFRETQKNTQDPIPDSVEHLTTEQREAWRSILSSAASAEGEEEHMVRPLVDFFAFAPAISAYVNLHAADELRHAKQIKTYLYETFGYVKTQKTLSDRIIYDQIFARLHNLILKRPLPFIATLLFYEIFAEDFYAQLRSKAETMNLPQLTCYLRGIQKDELRHRAGVKWLFSYWGQSNLPVYKSDVFWMNLMIFIVKMDISASWWAFWNRRLRRSLKTLDIQPDYFSEKASAYSRIAEQEIAVLRQ